MATLASKGLDISRSILFSSLIKKASRLLGKPGKIALLLHGAYQKLTSAKDLKGGFAQIKDMMLTLIRLVGAFISGRYRQVSRKFLILGVATLLYLVLPFDLMPDFLPTFGLLDDLSLMAWFIRSFQDEIQNFQLWESQQPSPAS